MTVPSCGLTKALSKISSTPAATSRSLRLLLELIWVLWPPLRDCWQASIWEGENPFKAFHIHLDNLRSWTGSLEENQDAITDLHTDSIFATPAFEVSLSLNHSHRSCEGVEIPQQSSSSLLLSSGFPLQRFHLRGRIWRSKHQQRICGTRWRHSLHLQEWWCFSGVAQYGTGQDYQTDGQGMDHLCQKPKGIFRQ